MDIKELTVVLKREYILGGWEGLAKSVAVTIIEARISEGKEHLQLKIQESHDRIADLEQQKKDILGR